MQTLPDRDTPDREIRETVDETRREETDVREQAPAESTAPPETQGSGDLMERYRKAKARLGRLPEAGERAGMQDVVQSRAGAASAKESDWLNDREKVREAFIFSECIGKPRAVNPHPYFSRKENHRRF